MKARARNLLLTFVLLAAALAVAAPAFAQGGLTGQISGTVVDNTKAVLPGVTVTAKNVNTQVTREALTDGTGAFVITNLLAGVYDIRANLAGFKAFEQTGLELGAQQRLSLPAITLEVGGVTETVSVQAEVTPVQVTSGERSAVMKADQILDIGIKGRDFMGALKILPGVVDTSSRDAPGWGSVGGMSINGQTSFNFSYDGIVSKDTGSNSGNYAAPGLDSIAEVKVQSSNFQAEYGRSSGASITVVTKSGTKNFRGTVAFYKRDERFNANTFDRRRSCDSQPTLKDGSTNPNCNTAPYRFNNTAWTIGGPVVLPGNLNKNRDKLFFFFSQDLLPRTDPGNLSTVIVPTALERQGDFSQTVNSAGNRIWIKDSQKTGTCNVNSGGAACFTNNIIPANRLDPIGRAIMNLLPLPNAVDPSGNRQFNFQYQNVTERPRNDQVLRVDWNVRPGTTFYSRFQFGHEVNNRSQSGFLGASGNRGWPQFYTSYEIQTYSTVNTLIHTFGPTTVLEVIVGQNWSEQSTRAMNQQTLDANDRTKVLPGLSQFYPNSNPLNLLPNVTFEGNNTISSGNMVRISYESRYPFNANNITSDVNLNLTSVRGHHNMKAGVFIEHNARPASRSSNFNGDVNFNANTSNPYDSNYGFANALLGSINAYTESTTHPRAEGRYNQVEFFAQDSWRMTNRFTVDFGIRGYYVGSTFVAGQKVAYFDPTKFSAAAAPLLYQPVCLNGAATCSGANRGVKNPLTGQLLNSTYISKLVPGSGDFYNGMVTVDQTPYSGWWAPPAARADVAWDVTGDGKTAVRGGFGTFYDRYSDDIVLRLVEQPPLMDTQTTNFTTIPQLLSSQLVQSTRGVNAFDPNNFHAPTVYNWSLGVQRELPFKLTADVAYVGNAGRYNSSTLAVNSFTYGTQRTDLNPQNADPTNNGQPKDADYLRPLRGYSGTNLQTWKGYSNYHSIQISVQRRFSNGLAWGIAYTGSIRRSLGTFDQFICPNSALSCSAAENEAANKARNYTKGGSRPHNFVVNYNYQVPSLSKHLHDNPIVKGVADGWQLSGITTIQSGTWGNIGYSFTGAPFNDMTGGPGGSRVVYTCDPELPRGERTFDRQFRTECVTFPGPKTLANDIYYLGNSLGDEHLGLGYINHDLTIFKNFTMTNRRSIQFRFEMYNAPNQTQYGSVNTGAQFNFATGAQTNANFGKVTGARANSSRVIQLGLRFAF